MAKGLSILGMLILVPDGLWLAAPAEGGDVEAGEVEDAVDDGGGYFVDGFGKAVEGGGGGADDAAGEG
jgi:hypothetical protein